MDIDIHVALFTANISASLTKCTIKSPCNILKSNYALIHVTVYSPAHMVYLQTLDDSSGIFVCLRLSTQITSQRLSFRQSIKDSCLNS